MYGSPETSDEQAIRRNAEAELQAVKKLLEQDQLESARFIARFIGDFGLKLQATFLCQEKSKPR